MNSSELYHYGVKYRSGRYPYGSGEDPYQHDGSKHWSYEETRELRRQGLSDAQIADYFGISQSDFRRYQSQGHAEKRAAQAAQAVQLRDKGMSLRAIAERMDISESQVRNLINPTLNKRALANSQLKDVLKEQVAEKGHIDVGKGVEQQLLVTDTKLKQAIKNLEEEGYVVSYPRVEQMGTGHKTTVMVLSPPGTPKNYVYNHTDEIRMIDDIYAEPGEDSLKYFKMHPPEQVDLSRIEIKYVEDGAKDRDGIIGLRKGVQDLDLGDSNYAQVRIAVGGKYYLKGMAVYTDDIPPGKDIVFYSKKSKDLPLDEIFKKQDLENPTNPFGTSIKKQNDWTDEDGVRHQGAINLVKEQGDWSKQQLNLASQMLSKQSVPLAKRQLDIDYARREDEFRDICALTNPAVKKKMLATFEQECDAAAVHLKAAAMPRQSWNVLIPSTTLKENEIYAPRYQDGETVVLIRYPHGGKFEMPQLTVNNRDPEGKRTIGNDSSDAVCIHPSTFSILSGADADGDTVLVIPNPKTPSGRRLIQNEDPLPGLKNFDTEQYKPPEGVTIKKMSKREEQLQMGIVSNLITDMTLKGAPREDLERAVKHSMVVIDARKHGLDYKRSEKDNDIESLKKEYQMHEDGTYGGASTLISQASSTVRVPERRRNNEYHIDPETGEKIFNYTKREYEKYNKKTHTTKTVQAESESTKMYEAKDARELMSGPGHSGTPMENTYANYANRCKALANQARKEYMATPNLEYKPESAKKYAKEVASLNSKLNDSLKNAPLERQAQLLANYRVKGQIESAKRMGEELTYSDIQKMKGRAIGPAREDVGAKKKMIKFTDEEWEAIQNGAISHTKLTKLLQNADQDDYIKRAMPKETPAITAAKLSRARGYLDKGYTLNEVADMLNVSPSYLDKSLRGEKEE